MAELVVKVGGIIFLVFAGAIGLSLLLAFPVKWCWNCAIPDIFGLKAIGFWQAWCLTFLAGTFFKASLTTKSNE